MVLSFPMHGNAAVYFAMQGAEEVRATRQFSCFDSSYVVVNEGVSTKFSRMWSSIFHHGVFSLKGKDVDKIHFMPLSHDLVW